MQSGLRDLRFGARTLIKNPAFSAIAILVIALGVGANTAIFSIVNAVLLQPLPFADPDRLIVLSEQMADTGERMSISLPSFLDWRAEARSFDGLAGYRAYAGTITGIDPPTRLNGRLVSAGFFEILGVKAILGRSIGPDDDKPSSEPVVVVSYACWQSRFGADPHIVGRKLILDDQPRTIIGVLPPGFQFGDRTDEVFVPLVATMSSNQSALERGNHQGIYGLARMKKGVFVETARTEIKTIASQLEKQYPLSNSGVGANAVSLYEQWVGQTVRTALFMLLAAVNFVLLIACTNVANLLLSRGTVRQREIAIRTALGASRWRIFRQLLTESVLLSGVGGVLGFLLAFWGTRFLLKMVPTNVPRIHEVHIDARVLAFALALSGMTGIVFGLVPALEGSRTDVNQSLKAMSRSLSRGSSRFRQILLASEVALALVLSVGAGLLIHSIVKLGKVDPGFQTRNLLTFSVRLTNRYKTDPEQTAFFRQATEQIRVLPGVKNAATIGCLPIDGTCWGSVFLIEGRTIPERSKLPTSQWNVASEQYFETMGIRLLRGRTFQKNDTDTSPAVAVISETTARRFFPNEDPIGKQLKQGWPESKSAWRQIVGVVGDVREDGLDTGPVSEIYVPESQDAWNQLFVVIRTAIPSESLLPAAMKTIRDLDKDQPVFSVQTMDKVLSDSMASRRFSMTLLGLFAGLAFILAAVGVYGVISYSVSRRAQEIGIRMALGASRQQVVRLVLHEGLATTAIGIVIGLIIAIVFTRAMSRLLFGISNLDIPTYAIASCLLI
ncbi:MAG TPA: ABC transporter permease, partial [Candidatus Dormibacteraeota bacterium]|nr:ABC transporter permease [Candidatus Dormibacteraeota bacterium]